MRKTYYLLLSLLFILLVSCQENKQPISITLESGILECSTITLEAKQDTPIALPNGDDLWTSEKYTFECWKTADNLIYDSGSQFFSHTSTTLYAVWGESNIIQYFPNGGDEEPIIKYFKKSISIAENMFTRRGYSFLYWSNTPDDTGARFYPNTELTASEPGTRCITDQVMCSSTSNTLTLYAIWNEITTISYDSNGGTGSIQPQYYDADNDCKQLADGNILKREGFVFACWNTAADGSGKNYGINNWYTDKEDVTLYAQWLKEDLGYSINSYGNPSYQWFSYKNKSATKIIIPEYYKGRTICGIDSYGVNDCSKITSITIPENIKAIREFAFESCTSLEAVELPSSGCRLDTGAFYFCKNLKSVKNVTNLSSSADRYVRGIFEGCSSLFDIEILEGVREITASCFSRCISLSSVTIPSTVTSIGSNVFYNCTNLKNINYSSTMDDWSKITLHSSWNVGSNIETITCTDGVITI